MRWLFYRMGKCLPKNTCYIITCMKGKLLGKECIIMSANNYPLYLESSPAKSKTALYNCHLPF